MSVGRVTRLAILGDVHDHQPRLTRVLAWLAAEVPLLDAVLLVGDIAGNPPGRCGRTRRAGADAGGRGAHHRPGRGATGAPVASSPGTTTRDLPLPQNVDRRSATLADGPLRVWGVGGAGPGRWGLPYEWAEEEVAALVVPPCDVLLAHAPPRGTTLDRLLGSDTALGSAAIRGHVLRHHGLFCCGHIHEGFGAEVLGDALCVNAGGIGEPHGAAQVALIEARPEGAHDGWHARLVNLDADTEVQVRHRSAPAAHALLP